MLKKGAVLASGQGEPRLLKLHDGPVHKLSAVIVERSDGKSDEQDDSVKVLVGGRSAFTTAMRLQWDLTYRRDQEGNDQDLETDIKFVSELLALFSKFPKQQPTQKIPVDEHVVDRWDRLFQDKSKHDTIFETSDGQCSAHSTILSLASPVLQASLNSSMREGQHKQIAVKDSSSEAVNIFLELIYIGGVHDDVNAENSVAALELAHRWQVQDVVGMLESLLQDLLTSQSFERIASAAQRMQLDGLRARCIAFGEQCPAIQKKLGAGALPQDVRDLLVRNLPSSARPGKKRRML